MIEQQIFATDGSFRRSKSGAAAFWSCIELLPDSVSISCGKCKPKHTSNRGELTAILQAFNRWEAGKEVVIYSDSKYCIGSISKWMYNWKHNGWLTQAGEDVKNQDIFKELIKKTKFVPFVFHHVKGHSGVAPNELADLIAELAADNGLKLNGRRIQTGSEGELEELIHLCKPKKRIDVSIEDVTTWLQHQHHG